MSQRLLDLVATMTRRVQAHADEVTLLPPASAVLAQRVAHDDRVSISIHCYGGNIGHIQRHAFAPDGAVKPFVSGYSNALAPNLWASA